MKRSEVRHSLRLLCGRAGGGIFPHCVAELALRLPHSEPFGNVETKAEDDGHNEHRREHRWQAHSRPSTSTSIHDASLSFCASSSASALSMQPACKMHL